MDSVKKALGGKVDQAVTVVNNTASALQVFYKIGTNPEYLDTVVFLIKKDIKQKLKALGNGPIMTKFREFVDKIFPAGRKLLDFVKCCIICAALKFVGGLVEKFNTAKKVGGQMLDQIKDQAQDVVGELLQKMTGLDTMVNGLTQASGVFAILKGLGIANELLFELLTNVNKKIQSVRVG
jgi:hypothetical protein